MIGKFRLFTCFSRISGSSRRMSGGQRRRGTTVGVDVSLEHGRHLVTPFEHDVLLPYTDEHPRASADNRRRTTPPTTSGRTMKSRPDRPGWSRCFYRSSSDAVTATNRPTTALCLTRPNEVPASEWRKHGDVGGWKIRTLRFSRRRCLLRRCASFSCGSRLFPPSAQFLRSCSFAGCAFSRETPGRSMCRRTSFSGTALHRFPFMTTDP